MAAAKDAIDRDAPRNFYLLQELEMMEKGLSSGAVSFGLDNPKDISLSTWNAMIMGPQGTTSQDRFMSLKIQCGPRYPDVAPDVQFVSAVKYSFVGSNGKVNLAKVKGVSPWRRGRTMLELLEAMRDEIKSGENRKQSQPPDGTTF